MIYVLTAIHHTIEFVAVQRDALRAHLPEPYRVHATATGLSPAQLAELGTLGAVDRLVPPGRPSRRGGQYAHAANLNALAADVCQAAADTDLLMFVDSDAWPIADPMPLVRAAFRDGSTLVAVRRAENLNEPQPHPLFAVITVGMWREIAGDWRPGHAWLNSLGHRWTDTGANMIVRLAGRPWQEILRSNTVNPHPVFFGVYGDVVYHHGAASRIKICRSDRAVTGADRDLIRERATENGRLSAAIAAEIAADPAGFWRRFVVQS